jgi:hypothetical protein
MLSSTNWQYAPDRPINIIIIIVGIRNQVEGASSFSHFSPKLPNYSMQIKIRGGNSQRFLETRTSYFSIGLFSKDL